MPARKYTRIPGSSFSRATASPWSRYRVSARNRRSFTPSVRVRIQSRSASIFEITPE